MNMASSGVSAPLVTFRQKPIRSADALGQTRQKSPKMNGQPKIDLFFAGRLNPSEYRIEGCTQAEAEKALPELLRAQAFARTNASSALKTPDNKRFFGAVLEFEDGQKFLSGNYILLRERPRCDIDNAITLGVNQWREQNWKAKNPLAAPKVKALYLANADRHSLANPCEDCLGLLNTSIFSPSTRIYTLEGQKKQPNSLIRCRTVGDMLPLHQGRSEPINWLTSRPVRALPVALSQSAKDALARMPEPISEKRIRQLIAQAKKSYEQSREVDVMTQTHAGSAVIISPYRHRIYTGSRFEWARRWPELADLNAAKTGLQKALRRQWRLNHLMEQPWMPDFVKHPLKRRLASPSVIAVAYYNDMPPSIRSLGRIRRHRGSNDTLVITVENDTIQIRTMRDYLPAAHNTPTLGRRSRAEIEN
jgi:hypothetical protein